MNNATQILANIENALDQIAKVASVETLMVVATVGIAFTLFSLWNTTKAHGRRF